jgi:tetratricopeptide (TPR) repeat protein
MTSVAPKSEGRRRAVSALALKLWEMGESLSQGPGIPSEVLDLLVMALGKGEDTAELWDKLHESAARHDQAGDLAIAYELMAQDKRVKLMQPDHQAHLHLRAAWFLAEALGDREGAAMAAERAVAAVPGHPEAFALLEELLSGPEFAPRLARHYFDASARGAVPGERVRLLRRAAEVLAGDQSAGDLAVEVEQQLFALDPADAAVRDDLMQRLIARGRHQQVVDILEASLRREPPPHAEEAQLLREQAMDICLGVLHDSQRALGHVEGLLTLEPTHAHARKLAEELVPHRQLGLRAAAALSTAYERSGETARAVEMLGHELTMVRGPRRVEVQRKLGTLRQDVLGDPAGALELLGPVVAGDPGDDELRGRFVKLSLELGQSAQAARLLSRALTTSRDAAVRARVAADVGEVYLSSGDPRRALAAFQQATELGSDEQASLRSARRLTELYDEAKEPAAAAAALELVTRLEPEPAARQSAARRLARLVEKQPGESARAATAWRALIGSEWNAEALDRLEAIYRESGDEEGLADVLGLRAEATTDPEAARALLFQAAEMRSSRPRDRAAAIAAWQVLAERYGQTPEIDQRLLPLLEAEGRFADVASVLERRAEIAGREERVPLLVRIGQLRSAHLGDPAGALGAFSEVLRIEPTEPTSRAALERLLGVGDTRLAAADVLEPIYRAEGASEGLLRVLEVRAELGTDEQTFAALSEALALAEGTLESPDQALEIAGWGLERAVALSGDIPRWLADVERLGSGSSAWRAVYLADALADRAVDTPELFELARTAGAALSVAGDLPRAIEIYRRALVYAPSSRELLNRVDELLAQQGAPEQRLGLYLSALVEETEPTRRRELLHAMATLQGRELEDKAGALASWRMALQEDPRDLVAHDAVVAALTDGADWHGLYEELARVLPSTEGERRSVTMLRLGEVAAMKGDSTAALTHYRELMQSTDLSDDVLEMVEHLARECGDGQSAREALERRLAHTGDPLTRAVLLERLGNVLAWMLEDRPNAARIWLEGARLSMAPDGDRERARQLYERVLDADPSSREAAERLVELLAEASDWERLEEVFGVLVGLAGERDVIMLLLGLEDRAVEAGRLDAFVRLLDAGIERVGTGRSRHLLLAKARALGGSPGRVEEAVALYRSLLERAGDDAAADAEAFSAFLRAAPETPERAADLRWLFEWRLARTLSPTDVLGEWAEVEEKRLGNPQAAADLYGRLVEIDPDRIDAWGEIARLELGLGRNDKAFAALEALKSRTEGETRHAAAVKLAGLLVSHLGRPAEALEAIAPVLDANPGDLEALRIVHRAFEVPECRPRASALLERIASVSDDRVGRAEVIEALLAVSAEAPELARARTRWLAQLLRTKQDNPGEALALALQGAQAAPEETELWDAAHEMARKIGDPSAVAEAYERSLERELGPEVASAMGARMVEFLEEWFDDPDRVLRVLERVLLLSPAAEWAFDRLKLTFNAAGRWQELFALYDRRLAFGSSSKDEEIALLREASMAAKDFASDAERAIGYLERLNRLSPGDTRVETTLERLYERHGRTRPLIDLLTARLVNSKTADKAELTARVAALWLDLGETVPAFALSKDLLESKKSDVAAMALLERILTLPVARQQRAADTGPTVLESSALLLEQRYRNQDTPVDVVRMLEIEVDCATDRRTKAALLSEAAQLRKDRLDDKRGAFETLIDLVALSPTPEHRERLAELAGMLQSEEQRAETLVSVAGAEPDPALKAELLLEAAFVYDEKLEKAGRAAELFREVVRLRDKKPEAALAAGKRLAELLRSSEENPELVTLLEVLATLDPDAEARRDVLGEAAERSLSALNDPARAIRNYGIRLQFDPKDRVALDGLCRALELAGRWDELVEALEVRAAQSGKGAARDDRRRIAQIQTEVKRDLAAAVLAWERLREVHGPDLESFEGLRALLVQGGRFDDLTALYQSEIEREKDAGRRRELELLLGDVHENRTGRPLDALDAYAAAGDFDAAIRVAARRWVDAAGDIAVVERLLALAETAFRADRSPESENTLRWGLSELCRRLLEAGRDGDAVARLLSAAELPFPRALTRELRRDAAALSAERLNDAARAVELYNLLLAEDPSDPVADECVLRLSDLLQAGGRFGELCDLWEAQGLVRTPLDPPRAADLFARAAVLAEEKLDDAKRAFGDYQLGAELGSEMALEALARIFETRKDHENAAAMLERLTLVSSPEALGGRALRLAAAYTSLGDPGKARECLERSLRGAAEASGMRKRLGELYRDARDFSALTALLEEEARLAPEPAQRLAYLKEAAALHQKERKDPTAAVPLLEQAVALDRDDAGLRVGLALALDAAGRHADAAVVLREQIQSYGARRPKDRAQVHFELSRVLLAGGAEAEALAELDAASRIDPTHPGITQLLASVAFRQGELDRAERMYRALLLTAGKDASGPGRTEALVALGEIASRRGDHTRAAEFLESAFESALENPREADLLEGALRTAGKKAELARLLEARLSHGAPPEHAARAIGELVELHWEAGRIAAAEALHRRARTVLEELSSAACVDDDVWAALGRGFELLDDAAAVATVLEHRVNLGARSSRPPADADLFYRLATARLADPATRTQGLGLLERAMDLRLDLEQASTLLGRDLGELSRDPRVVALRERVARASGDQRGLVRVLAERAALPGAGMAEVREGIDLARELGEADLIEALARAALGNGALSLAAEETGWLKLELASVLEQRGDASGAFTLREQAADELPEADKKQLLIELGAAAEALGDDARASDLYAKVLALDPAEGAAFRPLLALHAKSGKRDAWLSLVEQTIGIVEDVSERSGLRLEQARALAEKKSGVKRAIDVLNDLLIDEPGRPEAFELLADLLARAGREGELADLLARELDSAWERGDAPAARTLASKLVATLERAGKAVEAAEICQRALDFGSGETPDPELARTLLRLAEATGEVDRIADALERVLKVESGSTAGEIGKRLATLREAQGDDAGAERALELAAAANPEDAELRKTLIARLEASGNVARATELIQRTLQAGGGDPELLERWAALELAAGNHEQVVAALGRLIEASPEDATLYRRRAVSLGELHREDDGLEDLRRAASLDPSLGNELVAALEQAVLRADPPRDSELALELVNLFESRGDLESARARLADFLMHKPEDLDGFRRLAALDQQLGNAAEALITLERLVALETGSGLIDVALSLADAAEKAERPEVARPALERAFEAEPEHEGVRTRLEALYATLGAYRELGELLLQQSAFVADAASRLALVLRAAEALLAPSGDVATAVRVLEVARQETPASIEAATLLAKAYAAAGTPERGLEVLKGVAQANRGRRTKAIAQVYEQIANIHLEEGFLSDALEALSKAFESDNKNARMALDIGRLALELEEGEAAQRAYRAVTIMRAPGPEGGGATAEEKAEANFQLAALARKAGDARKARVLVSKALAESPGHEGARTLLAELDQR